MSVVIDSTDAKRWTDVLTALLGGRTLAGDDYANIESLWDLVEAILLAAPTGGLELSIRTDKRRNFSWRNGTITKALKRRLGAEADFPQGMKVLDNRESGAVLLNFLGDLDSKGCTLWKTTSRGLVKIKPMEAVSDYLDIDLDALELERKEALERVRSADVMDEYNKQRPTEMIH